MPVPILAFFILEALLAWGLWRCLAQSGFAFARKLGDADRPRRSTIYWLGPIAILILMAGLARAGWLVFVSDGGILFACAQDVRFCP